MNISECTDIFCNGQALTKLYSGKYLIWQKKKSADYTVIITVAVKPNVSESYRTVYLKNLGGVIDWGDGTVDEKNRKHIYPENTTGEVKSYTIKIDISDWKPWLPYGSYITYNGQTYQMRSDFPAENDGSYLGIYTSLHFPEFKNTVYPFLLRFMNYGTGNTFSNVKSLTFDKNFFGDVLNVGFPLIEKLSFKVFSRLTFASGLNNNLKELSVIFTDTVKEFALNYAPVEKVTIDCKNIINNMFAYSDRISSFTMKNVESIGTYAFRGCAKLTEITIPETVRSIGRNAFYSCSELVSITILEGLTEIGDFMAGSCRKLAEITIPKSVTKISDKAFTYSNPNLKTIKGVAGSYAETWARNHGFEFVAI